MSFRGKGGWVSLGELPLRSKTKTVRKGGDLRRELPVGRGGVTP